jgi:hypothetical protein
LETVNAAGSDVKENKPDSRPIYSFGKTEVQKEEDWLVEMQKARIKEEKKPKSKPAVSSPELTKTIRVEEIEDLSAGIDDYIKEQLNRDWLGEVRRKPRLLQSWLF